MQCQKALAFPIRHTLESAKELADSSTHHLMELNNNIFTPIDRLVSRFKTSTETTTILHFLAGKVTKVNLVVIEDDIDGYKLPIL